MSNYPELIKKKLITIIHKMAVSIMPFVKNPKRDFTRNRRLSFESMIKLILSMGGNSIYSELLNANEYQLDTVTTSAFVQQRDKILPSAFEFLFHEFTNMYTTLKKYQGYRLIAVDGSKVNIVYNAKDKESHFDSRQDRKGYNQLHLNVMYNLCNKIYIDSIVQKGRKENEFRALCDMVDRSTLSHKTVILADRGYESYNVFAHIEQKGWNYAIRVKDIYSYGFTVTVQLIEE